MSRIYHAWKALAYRYCSRITTYTARFRSAFVPQTYLYPASYDEDQQQYLPGGYLPVSIGDQLKNGRYQILHKLGYGYSSTVWLARDRATERGRRCAATTGELVALKILKACRTIQSPYPGVYVPRELRRALSLSDGRAVSHIQTVKDHFIQLGPSGRHLCMVSRLEGPSLDKIAIDNVDDERLRGELARKLAKQLAGIVNVMHSHGLVHGGESIVS